VGPESVDVRADDLADPGTGGASSGMVLQFTQAEAEMVGRLKRGGASEETESSRQNDRGLSIRATGEAGVGRLSQESGAVLELGSTPH